MEVRLVSAAAPGRAENEDHAFALGGLAGVLDGVTQPVGIDSGCVHTPAWYVRHLAAQIAAAYTYTPAASLPQLLATAIDAVRLDHGGMCDLENPATPAATVCLLKDAGEHAEYLVLCDSTLVLDIGGEVDVVVDKQFHQAIRWIRETALVAGAVGSEGHADRIRQATLAKHRYTNQPDGYWIAAANPLAAHQAVSGTLPLRGKGGLRRAALLTDGVSCAVDPFGLVDWTGLLDILSSQGGLELIRRVRAAELADPDGFALPRYKRHDDATAALCLFQE